jgi:regulator of sigma E protease
VLIHEAGHFFTARAVGMRPRKFYVGFPPALVKRVRNGIEYGIGTIPLGGYVKIPGMFRPAASDVDRALEEAPELSAELERVRAALLRGDVETARLEAPALDLAIAEANVAAGDEKRPQTRALTDLADALAPDAYWRARTWKRIAVILAGPVANIVLAVILFAAVFMIGGGKATTTVDRIVPGSVAAQAGLQSGDRIVTIGGQPVHAADVPARIRASRGAPIVVVVSRGGKVVKVGPVKARRDPQDGVYRLGFALRGAPVSAPEAAWLSVQATGRLTKDTATAFAGVFSGKGRKQISSTVGVYQATEQAASRGLVDFLSVMGLISLSLALLNLLPLLPLDGGHILFSLIEGVRGRAVRRETYERVSIVGIGLVLLLFVIGLSNDVGRLSGG